MNQYFFIHDTQNMLGQLKESANWILLLGTLLVVFGSLAIIYSFTSTLLSVLFLGGLLLAGGVVEAVQSFALQKWSTFLLHLLLSGLYILSGIFLISNPAINAISLTLVLAALFVASGIYKIGFALVKKVPHAGWLIFNGALSILLGVLVWMQWPVSGLWVLGTFMGIDLLFTGWTWIMLALAVKKRA